MRSHLRAGSGGAGAVVDDDGDAAVGRGARIVGTAQVRRGISPYLLDLMQSQSGRFVDHSVTIRGRVTTSWGVPLVGFNVYRVNDGTGEITVVSTDRRVPGRGSEVEVKGKVEDVAVLGGRPLGLHLREQRVRYREPHLIQRVAAGSGRPPSQAARPFFVRPTDPRPARPSSEGPGKPAL